MNINKQCLTIILYLKYYKEINQKMKEVLIYYFEDYNKKAVVENL